MNDHNTREDLIRHMLLDTCFILHPNDEVTADELILKYGLKSDEFMFALDVMVNTDDLEQLYHLYPIHTAYSDLYILARFVRQLRRSCFELGTGVSING